jgi:hypothetical protein
VYLSVDELIDLERARLTLRGRGITVDRGRLVREAIAVLLADLESGVDASVIARRLRAADITVNGSAPVTGAIPVAGAVPVTDAVPVTGAAVIGVVPVSSAGPLPGGAGLIRPDGAMPATGAGPAVGLPAEAL